MIEPSLFQNISKGFVKSYCKLLDSGADPQVVALAMLGATVNLYRLFEIDHTLPETLRAVADQLECGERPS